MLKNFEFKADEGAETIQKQSKLNREIQNISRVCMKKEQQADGSFKDTNSVSPSCTVRFKNMLLAKKTIHEGT